MFQLAQLHVVGFCWSSGRAHRAYARLRRQHEAAAAARRRQEVLARQEASGRSDRVCVAIRRQEDVPDLRGTPGEDLLDPQLPLLHPPIHPTRTVFY